MSTIQELEQKVRQLEQLIIKQQTETKAVLSKSDKALDEAIHAYRIDHAGYVWVWDPELKHYRKTDVCVRVIIPKVKPKEITNCKIADKAVNNRTLDDNSVDSRVLAKGAVKDRHIGRGEIHPNKFAPCVETEWLDPILNAKCRMMQKQIDELRQLVTSYVAHGVALSKCFGANDDIGITQRSITNEISRIWRKLNDITGEPGDGISVTFTPNAFVSETTGEIQVTVTSQEREFDSVKIYVNDELVIEKAFTMGFVDHFRLTETSAVKTVAVIRGIEYMDLQIISKIFPFFIGAGNIWTDAMTEDNARVYKGHLTGSYDVTVNNDGEKIFVIIPKHLANQMVRVDMNGFEVPMDTVIHGDYMVFESRNTYLAGIYNLDITNNCNCPCNDNESNNE